MRLPRDIKAAVNMYLACRQDPYDRWKADCQDLIARKAQAHGFSVAGTAGVFWFTRNGKTVKIDRPFPPGDFL